MPPARRRPSTPGTQAPHVRAAALLERIDAPRPVPARIAARLIVRLDDAQRDLETATRGRTQGSEITASKAIDRARRAADWCSAALLKTITGAGDDDSPRPEPTPPTALFHDALNAIEDVADAIDDALTRARIEYDRTGPDPFATDRDPMNEALDDIMIGLSVLRDRHRDITRRYQTSAHPHTPTIPAAHGRTESPQARRTRDVAP